MMTPWYIDFPVDDDIYQDALEAVGDPREVRKILRCNEGEHQKVRAYKVDSNGNRMATFACKRCGENLTDSEGNWVSQDDWTEEDWEAAKDWDILREDFDERVQSKKENRMQAIREMCRSRMRERRNNFQPPAQDANGQEWHDFFSDLTPGSEGWYKARKAYRKSDWWQSRRKRVLDAKGNTCRVQYPGCSGKATEIHHTSYEMIGFEPLLHLEPVCQTCHEKLHKT